ncbi:thioredoxin [Rhodopirellula sallentina]|uniref:Thioredoxin n=1 Tax=Rhodopirellula sallentina SM41 TaxID=1263870 RepID=M5UDJ4_9BACT|nr:thioredoxin [Rhodopirellula sallentina]EMI55926.1 thioredoxin [Rhodopirellula sallentina SM41]
MSAVNVNDQTFQTEVLESPKPVLVDFWAPWCGPCRMMGPVVDELADELQSDAVVVKVNVDEATDTATRYGVQSIPTFAVIKDGELVQQLSGVLPKETLRDALVA